MTVTLSRGRDAIIGQVAASISIAISVLALAVSITTAWLTLLRRGRLRMVQPGFVGFVWDMPVGEPKIFLRAMLYATGKRGHIIESLYLKVECHGTEHLFAFWTFRQENRMVTGGGLRVGEEGVSADLHFLPLKDAHSFQFLDGEYGISVWAKIVNRGSPFVISRFRLSLSEEQAEATQPNMVNGVFFNWQPEQGTYHSYIESEARTL